MRHRVSQLLRCATGRSPSCIAVRKSRSARQWRVAYRPAIFFGDSWAYLDLAYNGTPGRPRARPAERVPAPDRPPLGCGPQPRDDHDRAAPGGARRGRPRLRAGPEARPAAPARGRRSRRRAARRLRDRARAADHGRVLLRSRARGEHVPRRREVTRAWGAGGERPAARCRDDDPDGRAVRDSRLDCLRSLGTRSQPRCCSGGSWRCSCR